MPVLPPPAYDPPPLFRNAHLHTIYPSLFRRVPEGYDAERLLETPDGDVLEVDVVVRGAPRAAVLSHGLEGSTDRGYMRGMAQALVRRGWDVLAWNYRGCGRRPNRTPRSYHSGATDDLDVVVQHALAGGYETVALVGFSLGGNLTLKYLGERGEAADPRVRAAVAFSVPCDLAAGADHIDGRGNWLYRTNFLLSLRGKARDKQARFPDALADVVADGVRTIRDFDDRFTAPLHGFRDAADYYARCSCRRFLPGLRRPALLVSAADDPFLPDACYPYDLARDHAYLHLEVPRYGGHVGFTAPESDEYWSETRAGAFLDAVVA